MVKVTGIQGVKFVKLRACCALILHIFIENIKCNRIISIEIYFHIFIFHIYIKPIQYFPITKAHVISISGVGCIFIVEFNIKLLLNYFTKPLVFGIMLRLLSTFL